MQRQEAIWYKRGRDVKPTYCKGHQKRSGTQAGPNQDSYVGNNVNMRKEHYKAPRNAYHGGPPVMFVTIAAQWPSM